MSLSSELQRGVLSEKSLGRLSDSTDTLNDKDLQNISRYGFQPSNHSVETIDKFTRWRIQIYRINRYTNNFDKMAKDIKSNLRDFLSKKGVYVKKIRLFPVSTGLFEAIKEELSWPQNDPDNPNQQQNRSTCYGTTEFLRECSVSQ
ncbi:hypothetical protein GcM3_032037 [Golovinomyces cichoracearum]|uniref:Uncharacterized protein n=1 Tax=Golovinomyces cichoracearum TaxID=62708 RepID=A0A420J4K4_9PEZI|nr:hypothetical protein GcM3_032037 [Golovinomyces cichoracearum]